MGENTCNKYNNNKYEYSTQRTYFWKEKYAVTIYSKNIYSFSFVTKYIQIKKYHFLPIKLAIYVFNDDTHIGQCFREKDTLILC